MGAFQGPARPYFRLISDSHESHRKSLNLVGARRLELPTPTMSKRCRYALNYLIIN